LSWVFYQPLPKTCTGTKINFSIHHVLKWNLVVQNMIIWWHIFMLPTFPEILWI
jgi:hypothetical protein